MKLKERIKKALEILFLSEKKEKEIKKRTYNKEYIREYMRIYRANK